MNHYDTHLVDGVLINRITMPTEVGDVGAWVVVVGCAVG